MMKKSYRRLTAALLALCLMLSLLPMAALADGSPVTLTVGGLNWSLDTETGTLTVTGSGALIADSLVRIEGGYGYSGIDAAVQNFLKAYAETIKKLEFGAAVTGVGSAIIMAENIRDDIEAGKFGSDGFGFGENPMDIFLDCKNLADIVFRQEGSTTQGSYYTSDGAVYEGATLLFFPESKNGAALNVPYGVTSFGPGAFLVAVPSEVFADPADMAQIIENAKNYPNGAKAIIPAVIYDSKNDTLSGNVHSYIYPEELSLSSALTLDVGHTGTLSVAATAENGTVAATYPSAYTWTSSDETVATVDAAGAVRAVNPGSAEITVSMVNPKTNTTLSAVCAVTVKDIELETVTLSSEQMTDNKITFQKLQAGGTQTAALTASVGPDTATARELVWTSSNPSVATVTVTENSRTLEATVTAVGEGDAVITAKSKTSAASAVCSVHVPVSVTGVSVSPEALELSLRVNEENHSGTLTAAVTPENADIKTVTWSIVGKDENGNEVELSWQDELYGLVTLSTAGQADNTVLVTANTDNKTGTVWVKATTVDTTAENKQATALCPVTVLPVKAEGIQRMGEPNVSMNLYETQKQTQTLTAKVTPADATYKTVTWKSSNPELVRLKVGESEAEQQTSAIDANGEAEMQVVAVGAGNGSVPATATVTATITDVADGSKTYAADWTVNVNPTPVTGVTLQAVDQEGADIAAEKLKKLKTGDALTLKAAVEGYAADAEAGTLAADATDPALTWTISNPDVLVFVKENGQEFKTTTAEKNAAVRVKVLKEGTAQVTATSTSNGDKYDTLTLKAPVTVASVTVNPSTATLSMDNILDLTATITPTDAAHQTAQAENQEVTWSIPTESQRYLRFVVKNEAGEYVALQENGSDVFSVTNDSPSTPVTVKVNAQGDVDGTTRAKVTVTTEDGGRTADCVITVTAKPVQAISLPQTLEMDLVTEAEEGVAGKIVQTLTATITPKDATDGAALTWTNSDASVVSLDTTNSATTEGKSTVTLTAKKYGEATVTVTAKLRDGTELTQTCKVTVLPVKVTDLSVKKDAEELADNAIVDALSVKDTVTLTAVLTGENRLPPENKTIIWTVTDPEIAKLEAAAGTAGSLSADGKTLTVTAVDGDNGTASAGVLLTIQKTGTVTVTAMSAEGVEFKKTVILNAPDVTASSITLDGTNKTIDLLKDGENWTAEEFALTAALNTVPTNKKVTWSSTNNKVLLSADGTNWTQEVTTEVSDQRVTTVQVKAKAPVSGGVTVRATALGGNVSASCVLTVRAKAQSIRLSAEKLEIELFTAEETHTKPLTATVLPEGSDQHVTWSVKDKDGTTLANPDDYLTITGDTTGYTVKGLQTGVYQLVATSETEPTVTAVCEVTVVKSVSSVTVADAAGKTDLELLKGKETNLTATFTPATPTNRKLTWTTSNKNAVMFKTASGELDTLVPTDEQNWNRVTIIAKGAGSATITATAADGGKSGSVTVRVPVPVDSVSINGNKEVQLGATTVLSALFTPANADNRKITWTIEEESGSGEDKTAVFLVPGKDEAGNDIITEAASAVTDGEEANSVTLKGLKEGKVKVKATTDYGVTIGEEISTTLEVTIVPVPATGISLDRSSVTLSLTQNSSRTAELTAAVTPEAPTYNTVTWTVDKPEYVKLVNSENQNVDAITGTLDADGKSKVTIKSIAPGTATVTATINKTDGSTETFTAQCTAVVSEVPVTKVEVSAGTIKREGEDKAATAETLRQLKTGDVVVLNAAVTGVESGEGVTAQDATKPELTWSVTDSSALEFLKADGNVASDLKTTEKTVTVQVRVKKEGAAAVTAVATADGSKKAVVDLYAPYTVESVRIAPETLTLWKDDSAAPTELTAIITPANADNKKLTWSLDSTEYLNFVDANGALIRDESGNPAAQISDQSGNVRVKAVKQGAADGTTKAKVTVTTDDGGKTATLEIPILPTAVTRIELPNTLDMDLVTVADAQQGIESKIVQTLTAAIIPSDATDGAVLTWTSSDASVVSLDTTNSATTNEGKSAVTLTALKDGQATVTVTATLNDHTVIQAECLVTVAPVQVTNLALAVDGSNVQPDNMKKDATVTLIATVTGQNNLLPKNRTIQWSSTDAEVATLALDGDTGGTGSGGNLTTSTLDENGKARVKVNMLQAGSATITATISEGGQTFTRTILFKVPPVPVTGITLSGAPDGNVVELLRNGDNSGWQTASFQLRATLTTADGQEPTDKTVHWTANAGTEAELSASTQDGNSSVITVTLNQPMTDKLHITATATGVETGTDAQTAEVYVTVRAKATGVTVYNPRPVLEVDETVQLSATVTPTGSDQTVTWSAELLDEPQGSIRTVDNVIELDAQTGAVKALAAGKVKITATSTKSAGVTGTCEITVVKSVTGVEIKAGDATAVSLLKNSTVDVTATFAPTDATGRKLTWTSSNGSAVLFRTAAGDVSRIPDADVSTVTLIAVGAGTSTITATAENGVTSNPLTVTVPVPVESISISASKTEPQVGETITLHAVLSPENAENQTVTWTLPNTEYAAFRVNGNEMDKVENVSAGADVTLLAKKEGQVTVTVASAEQTATPAIQNTLVITVKPVPVTAVAIDANTAALSLTDATNKTKTLTATVTPATATNTAVTWKSSDPNVVKFQKEGQTSEELLETTSDGTSAVTIVAVGAGEATVSVTIEEISGQSRTFTAACAVTVEAVPATALAISGGSTDLAALTEDAVVTITGTLTGTAGLPPENKTIIWYSGDTDVAVISAPAATETVSSADGKLWTVAKADKNESGVLTGTVSAAVTVTIKKTGTVTIYARTENGTLQKEVVLKAPEIPVTDMTLAADTSVIELVKENESWKSVSVPVTATLTNSAGKTPTNKTVTWTSSDSNVASLKTVSTNQSTATVTVTVNKPGTAVITAVAEGSAGENKLTKTLTLTVRAQGTGVRLSSTSLTLELADATEQRLTATVLPPEALQSVTWTLKEAKKPDGTAASGDVVELTADGLTATLKPVAAGAVTVVAASKTSPEQTAECVVTVKKSVTGLTVTAEADTVRKGETTYLSVAFTPTDATDQKLTWTSSNGAVILFEDDTTRAVTSTASEKVKIKATGGGSATVTATSADGVSGSVTVTVPTPVDAISVNPSQATVKTGETVVLTPSFTPPTAADRQVTWTITGSTVVKFTGSDELSLITDGTNTKSVTLEAVGVGTATVTATSNDGNKIGTATITVQPVPVSRVALNQSSLALNMTDTLSAVLTATVSPDNAANQTVSWTAEPVGVVTLSNTTGGTVTVTAVKPGTATVRATTADGGYIAACTVTVAAVPVDNVTLDKTVITDKGNHTLTATVRGAASATPTNTAVNWLSTNPAVATVQPGANNTAAVNVTGEGSARIYVTTEDGAKTAYCDVNVPVKVTAMSISTSSVRIGADQSYVLSATLTPGDAEDAMVDWSVASNDYLTFVKDGQDVNSLTVNSGEGVTIRAKKQGAADYSTVITVKATAHDGSGITKNCYVTVAPTQVTYIQLDNPSLTMNLYEAGKDTATLTATISPTDATVGDTLTWSTTSDAVTLTKVSDSQYTVKAEKAGTAVITVTAGSNGEYKATCAVTVEPTPVTGVSLNETEWTVKMTEAESTKQLTATVTGTGDKSATNQTVTWSSTNPAVATVDSNGLVTRIGAGTASIIAAAEGGKTAACTVTVEKETVTFDKTELVLIGKGSTGTITASAAPGWTITEGGSTGAANYSSNGAEFTFTAKSNGVRTLTLKVEENNSSYKPMNQVLTVISVTDPITGVQVSGLTGNESISASVDSENRKIKVSGFVNDKNSVNWNEKLSFTLATGLISDLSSSISGTTVTVSAGTTSLTYTIDTSGLVDNGIIPADSITTQAVANANSGVQITEGSLQVTNPEAFKNAAAAALAEIIQGKNLSGESLSAALQINVEPISKSNDDSGVLTLDVTPVYTIKSGTDTLATGELNELASEITLSVGLNYKPTAIRHKHNGIYYQIMPISVTGESAPYTVTWSQSRFSEIAFLKEVRSGYVAIRSADGSVLRSYDEFDTGERLPGDGLVIGGVTYTEVNDAFLAAIDRFDDVNAPVTATVFVSSSDPAQPNPQPKPPAQQDSGRTETGHSHGGSSGGSSGGSGGGTVIMTPSGGSAVTGGGGAEQPAAVNPFADVPADAYYFDAVRWAVGRGVTTGMTADAFGPEIGCTRAQTITFLWRVAGCPEPAAGTANPFADVAEDAYYYKAVLWAVQRGVTTGMTADSFGPDAVCTRAQVMTFLFRSAGVAAPTDSAGFEDVAPDAYYAPAVAWAKRTGVTTGTTDATFSPDKTCQRCEIVTFLYRRYGQS